ncbi:MAG: methyltransferase domain-containing protein [Halioglobus sp.]
MYRKEMFYPGFMGLFINPYYFARKGLALHLAEFAPRISGKVLDIGCGKKPYKSLFSAEKYTGLEIDTPQNRATGIADCYYDGNKIPFPDASFDNVISNQVFEHVEQPDTYLDESYRVLKPGGLFLITVPFLWDEHEQPHDYNRYTSYGIRVILERHEFEILEARKSVADIRVVFQVLNAYVVKATATRWHSLNLILAALLTAPANIVGEILYRFTPRNNDLYLDNVILARKRSTQLS